MLALALGSGLSSAAFAQAAATTTVEPAAKLKPSRLLTRPAGDAGAAAKPALVLQARKIEGQVDQTATAEGEAELRYGDLLLRADRLSYDIVNDAARASGHVEISRAGNTVRGPNLQLFVDRFEGEFEKPEYFFSLTGAGGQATSLKFLGDKKMRAEAATYSSCPAVEGEAEPAWQLRASSLNMDLETGEGVATGGVLRFQGVPMLAAPVLSFPLSGQRKSGWLPPNIGLDNRSGFEFGLPYYWNLAPQRDMTLTPFFMTRRGQGLDSEFRYLEPQHRGELRLAWLPNDSVTRSTRWAADLRNDGELLPGWGYSLRAERVSDDEYWKDLPRRISSATPRLLAGDLQLDRRRELGWGEARMYARVQRWQALQGLDTATQFVTPYQRSPQLGVQLASRGEEGMLAGYLPWGRRGRFEGALELEYNRFDLPGSALASQTQTGQRMHLLGHLSLPMGSAAWWLTPKIYVNAASYRLDQPLADGRTSAARSVPGFSLDHGWVFERDTSLFGRALLQTLEPRLMYVNTVYRDQSLLPNFDATPKDFTFDTIYTENQFSGVDRVSDAHQLTVGAVSRWLDANQGDELLRLGLVQRVRFSEQRITPEGSPNDQRLSDVLLLGAVHVGTRWWFEGSMQVNSDTAEVVRTVLRARFAPGPLRTVSTAYRLARGQSEQVEVAWQWPLFGAGEGSGRRGAASSGSSCSGAWYSAGRLQYSLRDSRFSDSLLGLEYDAGCWILRVGAERLSTGRSETNTRLLLQLELVGLSRLGSNALQVLRDNIPAYRPLSSERSNLLNASYD
jgi:LPS-assembly protein